MKQPLITIGITAFNERNLLIEAWDSILNQTTDDWEAVIVLNGREDLKTRKCFESIQHLKLKKYSYVFNQGPYSSRTKAIELTNTEWYFHLDADDLLPYNAVELILNKINQEPNAEFLTGPCEHFSLGPTKIKYPSSDPEVLCVSPLFFGQSPIKKKLFEDIGGYYIPDNCNKPLETKQIFHSDWDFWLSVYEKHIKGAEVSDIIYKRRRRFNNISNQNFHALPDGVEKIIDRHPIFFSSEQRKCKSRYDIYLKTARLYKSIGNRQLAKQYADLAIQHGNTTPAIDSINREYEMSVFRYFLRRLGRLI